MLYSGARVYTRERESERAKFEEREGAGETEGVDGRLQGLEF